MSEEGLIMTSDFSGFGGFVKGGYPPRPRGPVVDGMGRDLIPCGFGASQLWQINHSHPEWFNYKLPKYKLIVGMRCNDLTNCMNPQEMAQSIKDIYRIQCGSLVDETGEFADIFFPIPMGLEKFQVGSEFQGYMGGTIELKDYCVNFCQPVVPESQIIGKECLEIWGELAERAGFLPDYNRMTNVIWDLPKGYQLELDKKYSYREIVKRIAEGVFGRNLETFAQEGHIKWHKSVKERYPRPFFKARSPIYFEHHLKAGKELAHWVKEQGIEWDTSAYTALPEWRPTVTFIDTKPGFDLIAIGHRSPLLVHFWMTKNPWLLELAEHHPWGMNIIMNTKIAAEHGIKDGDQIVVEAVSGYKQEGRVKLTQCIHPEVVALSRHGGNWAHPVSRGKGTQLHALIPQDLKYLDTMFSGLETQIRVKVTKAAKK